MKKNYKFLVKFRKGGYGRKKVKTRIIELTKESPSREDFRKYVGNIDFSFEKII